MAQAAQRTEQRRWVPADILTEVPNVSQQSPQMSMCPISLLTAKGFLSACFHSTRTPFSVLSLVNSMLEAQISRPSFKPSRSCHYSPCSRQSREPSFSCHRCTRQFSSRSPRVPAPDLRHVRSARRRIVSTYFDDVVPRTHPHNATREYGGDLLDSAFERRLDFGDVNGSA